MLKPLSDEKRERLEYFLKGDKYALLFCLDLLYVAHLWDDLIDGDKNPTAEDINQAFVKSLAEIPSNPFYQTCQPALLPMMYNALTLWLEANALDKITEKSRLLTTVLNNAVIEIIHFCILVKGDAAWAREVAPEFWELFGPEDEDVSKIMEM